jgi:hypothetical protein
MSDSVDRFGFAISEHCVTHAHGARFARMLGWRIDKLVFAAMHKQARRTAATVTPPIADAPALTPLAVAEIAARNLVPVAGILFFGWHAFNVLALYLLDTLLMLAIIIAGVARSFLPMDDPEWAGRINGEFGYVAAGLMVSTFMAVPLGIPLIFMAGGDFAAMRATLVDPAFRTGIVVQFGVALWSWLELRRAVDAGYSAGELRLKRRFALVFLRWMAMLMAAYTGLGFIAGRYSAFVFIVLYAGVSIVIDIAPDRFLRAMPGGAEDADPSAAEARGADTQDGVGTAMRRKSRRDARRKKR